MPRARQSNFDLAMEDQAKLDSCSTEEAVKCFFDEMDEAGRRRAKAAGTNAFQKKARAYRTFASLHREKLNKIMKRAADKARWKMNRAMRRGVSSAS